MVKPNQDFIVHMMLMILMLEHIGKHMDIDFQWRKNPGNWSLSYITWVAGGVCNSRQNIDLKWGGANDTMSLTGYTASADVNSNGLVKS